MTKSKKVKLLTTKKNKKEPRILGPEDDIGFEHESPKERVIRHMDYYRSLKLKTKTFQNREEFERFSPKDKKDLEDQGCGFVILDEFFEKIGKIMIKVDNEIYDEEFGILEESNEG